MRTELLLATLLLSASTGLCASILAMFPIGAKSHFRFLHPVAATLARAGHDVTVYSPFPNLLEHPRNLTHVTVENVSPVDQSANWHDFIQEVTSYPAWKCLDLQWAYIEGFYDEIMGDKKIKELLSSNDQFDLIISETFAVQEWLTVLLSWKFKAPVIGVQTCPTNNVLNSFMGNSLSLSYIPDFCTPFSDRMTLYERMYNTFANVRGLYYHYNYYIPKVEKKMRKDYPDVPPVKDVSKIVSLIFVNDHMTVDYPHPISPNIVPVAGLHIPPNRPLPQEIQKFMDEAVDGVIFFSLGTYVLDELQPQEYFDMYINVFKKLTQRVLWKTRKENIEGLPSNVMTVKWAPQPDVLAHPNCILFISHGGQLSKVEALHFGVPVASIGQFWDQHRNSKFYESKRVGVKLDNKKLTEESISAALHEVLYNTSYRENMKRLSAIFRDRPLSPAESVVFWTEYVLRHDGAAHLRPASTELTWYQLILLDIIVVFIFIFFILLCMFYWIIRKIQCLFKKSSTNLLMKKVN